MLLVSCGGGSTGGAIAPAGGFSAPASLGSSSPAIQNGRVMQTFTFAMPRGSGVSRLGITSSIESGTPEHDVTVGTGVSGCTPVGATVQCSFALSLPWGPQALTIATYATNVTRTQIRVGLGGQRAIALSTGATVAQVSLDLQDDYFSTGQAATTNLYVTARDANGNTIVGSWGGTTVTLSSSLPATSTAISLSTTTLTASTQSPVTVSYTGATGTGSSVTFTATATGVAASAITSATLSFTAYQTAYVGNSINVEEFAAGSNLGDEVPENRFQIEGYNTFLALPDGMGNLLVEAVPDGAFAPTQGGLSEAVFFKVALGATGPLSAPTPYGLVLPNGEVPLDAAFDGSHNLYVLTSDGNQDGGSAISVFAPNATSPSRVISGAATNLGAGLLNGIAVSSGGLIAVNQTAVGYSPDPPTAAPGSVLIFGAGASGNVAPARTISGASTGLSSWGISLGMTYLAWFPSGALAVSDINYNLVGSVLVFGSSANGNVAPISDITGNATSLTLTEDLIYGAGPGSHEYAEDGLGIDLSNRIYVTEFGTQSGLPVQIVRFNGSDNGNVVPEAVLGGPLTGLYSPGKLAFASAVLTPPSLPPASVSGDFFALAPNRGWNYSVTPAGTSQSTAGSPGTVTLYDDPQPQGSDSILVALISPTVSADATTGQLSAYMTVNDALGPYVATGYYSYSNFAGGPIPGGLQLTQPTMYKGQTWSPYPGLSAQVIDVGTNIIGSSACPGGGTPVGATVQYTFGYETERISYVPGCGITHLVTDSGAQVVLQSIGSYPTLGQLAERREPASLQAVNALRSAWRGVFSPWRP